MRGKAIIPALGLALLLPLGSCAAQPPPPPAPAAAAVPSAQAARQRQEIGAQIRRRESELNTVRSSLRMHGLTDQEQRVLTQQAAALTAQIAELHAQLQAIR